MRHLVSILVVLVWLGLMGALVRKERAADGQDASVLGASAEPAAALSETTEWFGVYQRDRKIGHARRVEKRTTDGWELEDESRLMLAMLGEPQTITTSLFAETAPDYGLRRFRKYVEA